MDVTKHYGTGQFVTKAIPNPRRLLPIRRSLPIYLFSSSEDPVGQQLEGLRILMGRYRSAGSGTSRIIFIQAEGMRC